MKNAVKNWTHGKGVCISISESTSSNSSSLSHSVFPPANLSLACPRDDEPEPELSFSLSNGSEPNRRLSSLLASLFLDLTRDVALERDFDFDRARGVLTDARSIISPKSGLAVPPFPSRLGVLDGPLLPSLFSFRAGSRCSGSSRDIYVAVFDLSLVAGRFIIDALTGVDIGAAGTVKGGIGKSKSSLPSSLSSFSTFGFPSEQQSAPQQALPSYQK